MASLESIQPLPFGSKKIGPGFPTVIIAEIGINHEGDPDACLRLVDAAASAGADAVKFQTVIAAENYAPGTESYDLFARAELSQEQTRRAFDHARASGLACFSTCSDMPSFVFLEGLAPAAWKISSGLLTHLPLIRQFAKTGRTLLLSTGMTGMAEAENAVAAARDAGARHIGIFQCTSLYPAPFDTLNLRAMETLSRAFGIPVGLSDHSLGALAPAVAVACGAHMVEKHISLDPSRPSFDHRVSLDPSGFKQMVDNVRAAEQMLGSAEKQVSSVVAENARKFLRCLAARRDLAEGTIVAAEDVAVMRLPAGHRGLPPDSFGSVLGRRLRHKVAAYHAIEEANLS
jgi:N,N'-diacetyllegionaminate synthase